MIPKISDAEWRVLHVLWEKCPRTANEIVDILSNDTDWNPPTIRTLINRLVQKGAVRFEKDGRAFLYFANVAEDECQREERKTFLSRVYNDSLKPMLAAFLEETDLSEEELDELEQLLKEKRKTK